MHWERPDRLLVAADCFLVASHRLQDVSSGEPQVGVLSVQLQRGVEDPH